ncbi:MAG TPA: CHAT domain-containing protein [Thermoanaerobaculia bacterium]|nr:CHAT domain-containing protein [Thermoanaerobaculia bacterium]
MDTGRFAGVIVDQQGIDVTVTLRGPDGRLLASVDSPQGSRVPEPIPFIATASGTWRVEVRAPDPKANGSYAFRIEALRPAAPEDRTRVRAERLLSHGEEMRRRDDRDSRQQAAIQARQASQLFRGLSDPGREADALYTLGSALYSLDGNAGARDAYERALMLFREVGRQREAGKMMNSLGRIHRQLGEPGLALERYREALALNRGLGDRRQEATTLQNLGRIYQQLGETEEALAHYEQALPIWRKLEVRSDEAGTLLALGDLYQRMGEPRKALDLLPRALALFDAEGAQGDAAATLTILGDAQARAGQVREALASQGRALAIQRRIGNRRDEGVSLNSIGCCHLLLGKPGEARRSLEAALAIFRQVRDRPAEAIALTNLGLADEQLGRPRKAIESLERAMPVLVSAGSREHEALALLGLARARRQLGDLASARQTAEMAIDRIESLRGKSASLGMRASFLASKQDFYGFHLDLLMELHRREPGAGYDARALAASEQARARSLLDMLAEAGAGREGREGIDPKLLQRETDLASRINDLDRRRRADSTVESELRELLTEQDRVQAEIRRTSQAITVPRPLTLPEIQKQVVDSETLLLQYALGAERSFLWVVTPDSLSTFELPPRAEVEDAARQAYSLLTASHRTLARGRADLALAELSKMLLGPAAGLLEGKRLVVVPDGALHYIPFSALPAPGTTEPLVERHEVVSLPSASSLAMLRREARPPAPATLVVIADPVFDAGDPRVSRQGPVQVAAMRGEKLGRLPFSQEEAKALLALAPPAERLGALGFDASRETVLSGRLSRYRLVHFATHGILDSANPELSGLLLSQVDPQGRPRDGFLRAHEIYRLKLPADLVVLSACRTALGREIRGEGLVGLTRGFLHAGARAVLVSLWEVEDRATAELMRRFYREMLQEGRPPAAALRIAQASLRREPGWEAPYFWAGFVLQGDWQINHVPSPGSNPVRRSNGG